MNRIIKVIKNRNFVLFLALFSGLFIPHGAGHTKPFALPALAVVMTLSTLGISGKMFRSIGGLIRPAAVGIVMNYFILGGLILALNALLIRDEGLWAGFVIVAATPPGVAIISLTDFMRGNRWLSLMGTVGGYLGALVVMPLVIFSFLGTAFFEPSKLLITIGQLIVAPLAASRILIYTGLDKRIEPIKGGLTNWSFFIIVYTIVGLNRDVFIEKPLSLVPVAVIAVLSTFFLGTAIDYAAKRFRLAHSEAASLVLLGTIKNHGLAGGLALSLFGQQTAAPATVSTVFMIVYFIWLGMKKRESVPQSGS